MIVIGAVVLLLLLTVLLGDRVGVTIERASPVGTARSTNRITMTFSERMNRDTVTANWTIQPSLDGAFSWSGDTLIFTPSTAMTPGTGYTVRLARGALSESGREVLSDIEFSFHIRTARVAYLYPSDDAPQNIWVVDPSVPGSAAQVTFSPTGIYDFSVSPDASSIAFAERGTQGNNDLKLLDIETGGIIQLTNCQDASCTTPVWRPDGSLIAYERVEFNSDLDVGRSPTRIWLVDPTVTPATTRPLFNETQILGYNAQWSADGSRIALFDSGSASILIYDFATGEILAIPSRSGTSGALSPDGQWLVFNEIAPAGEGQSFRQYLRSVRLDTRDVGFISTPDDPVEDQDARWRPDGETLAVTRRYTDERYTRGHQLVLIDANDPTRVQTLTGEPHYADGTFSWDATGTQLVIQRLRVIDDDGQPDNMARPTVWTLDVATGDLMQVAENAYLPRWIP